MPIREEETKKLLAAEAIRQAQLKEQFEKLFQVKMYKTINEVLNKRFTQLSYLPKDEQELNKLWVSNGIYRFLIHFLNQL